VLSVGDARFQDKSRDRIRGIVRDGRTVVYVSHSMTAVEEICDSAIVLEEGHVIFDGDTAEAIERYQALNQEDRTTIRQTTLVEASAA